MQKWNIKMLVYLGFLTSGVITFNAYNKDGLEFKTAVLIWLSTVLILESGKGISFFAFANTKKKSWLALWLSLMLVSIVGNMCFLVRDAVENKNTKLVFEDVKSKKSSIEEQIAYKKSEKQNVELEKKQSYSALTNDKSQYQSQVKEYNVTINGLQKQIDTKNKELTAAIKKKYAKTPGVIKSQISTLTDTLNKTTSARDKLGQADDTLITAQTNKSNKIDDEINALQTQANSISTSDSSPYKKVAGITTLFEYLGIGWEFAEFITYLFIAVIFEILICALYLHLQGISLRSRPTSNPLGTKHPTRYITNEPRPNPIPKHMSKPTSNITNQYEPSQLYNQPQYGTSNSITTKEEPIQKYKIKNKIGFNAEVPKKKDLNNEDVEKFLNVMFETAVNNKCIGYRKISRLAGIKEGIGKAIYYSLQMNGAIKVIAGVTTILKDREDIKL